VEDLVKRGRVKKTNYSKDMYEKEFRIGKNDLESAKESYKLENYKWATIQAIADYKETYSQAGAENIINSVETGLKEIEKYLKNNQENEY
jgi:HEPN domain-containing protein